MSYKAMINKERLADTFMSLVKIDSESGNEKEMNIFLKSIFDSLGAETIIDSAGEKAGSNTGNLIVKFKGNVNAPPLLFCAHTDTVKPGNGVKPIFKDGIFKSDGTTILGSDDKSAIAIIIEAIKVVLKNKLDFCPLEIVFTISEEVGLLGVKNLDYSLINASYGYVLDIRDPKEIIVRAPSSNRLVFKIHGKDAHAGIAPEDGINAISLASKATAMLDVGRIDDETTCNIGLIKGGVATNIVPDLVTVEGEVRSHSNEKLNSVTQKIISAYEQVIEDYPKVIDKASGEALPRLEKIITKDFININIPEDHYVVMLAKKAAEQLGRKLIKKSTEGGSDANCFFNKGIITAVLGTGMTDVHTVRESVKLEDMFQATELMLKIIKLHAEGI
ncbi:tripeptide aminopeptidase [Candidatus Magnetomoraceae bacterium gMMP-13]